MAADSNRGTGGLTGLSVGPQRLGTAPPRGEYRGLEDQPMMTRRRINRERRAYNRVRRGREGVGGALYAEKRWDGSREWCSRVQRPFIERREAAEEKAKCEAMWATALANGWVTEDGMNDPE